MIVRRVVPQFCFVITMTWPRLWFERGRINRRIPRTGNTVTSLFSTWWHGACVHALVPYICIRLVRHPHAPRPFIVYPNVRAEYLGQCCRKAKKGRRGKETDTTHGIEFTLAGRYCHQHSSHRHLMIPLGCLPWQTQLTHDLLQSPTSFPRWVMVDLNYNLGFEQLSSTGRGKNMPVLWGMM